MLMFIDWCGYGGWYCSVHRKRTLWKINDGKLHKYSSQPYGDSWQFLCSNWMRGHFLSTWRWVPGLFGGLCFPGRLGVGHHHTVRRNLHSGTFWKCTSLFCSVEKSVHADGDKHFHREFGDCWSSGDHYLPTTDTTEWCHRDLVFWICYVQNSTVFAGKRHPNTR